jgi:hypothetical protein
MGVLEGLSRFMLQSEAIASSRHRASRECRHLSAVLEPKTAIMDGGDAETRTNLAFVINSIAPVRADTNALTLLAVTAS